MSFQPGPQTAITASVIQRSSASRALLTTLESHASLDGVRLAIVHDIEALGNRSTYRNANVLLVPSVSTPPQQARWRAYVQAFRGAAAIPPDQLRVCNRPRRCAHDQRRGRAVPPPHTTRTSCSSAANIVGERTHERGERILVARVRSSMRREPTLSGCLTQPSGRGAFGSTKMLASLAGCTVACVAVCRGKGRRHRCARGITLAWPQRKRRAQMVDRHAGHECAAAQFGTNCWSRVGRTGRSTCRSGAS